MEKILHSALHWIGIIAAALLFVLAILALGTFLWELRATLISGEPFRLDQISGPLDSIMVIFIIIELLKISIAYVRDERIIPTVFETALVAILRKVVVLGANVITLEKAIGLTLVLVGVGVTWFLVSRSET